MFIIAEIGINHNGDISIAKELIKVASQAGANAVKFQKRTLDAVYTQNYLDSARESPWGKTQREQKEGLEFSKVDYEQIDIFCRELGIDWFASAWDIDSQKFMRQFDLKYNKVASAMIVYHDLLREIASEGRHTFISTGMSGEDEIDQAVTIFREAHCPFELMHCVSTYPMTDEDANLRRIQTLRDRYQCDVGYSGHEVGLTISFAAAALGISSLERHITLDRAMYGSDQAASIEPDGFRKLVRGVRTIINAMGDGQVRILEQEIPIAQKLRSHIPWQASQR
ncbi:MAG: N-acetylneuraminate synthase [Spirulina sp. SIO3F2]|nr:N-acetylneuraminate synthase [Spirulina sp. SIO3F2]